MARICSLLGHDKHELADAVRGLIDIGGSNEFVDSVTGDDIVVHIVLDEGVIALATDHGVKPTSTIEVVVAIATIEIVGAACADDTVQKSLRLSILWSWCVDVWAGVECRGVAEECVVASITDQGILAAHAEQERGGFSGEKRVA